MSVVIESETLHARVRAAAAEPLFEARTFDRLATDIARFQVRWHAGIRRLAEQRPAQGTGAAFIPAVPVDAFRLARIAVHPPELDTARFETSGTTGLGRGLHAFRTTETYRRLALQRGREALCARPGRRVVVALAPPSGAATRSSLGFMMRAFMIAWDGRALDAEGVPERFDPDGPDRWLVGPDGVDIGGLRRAARVALERGEPLLVLATGFALVRLLDALGDASIAAPPDTVVMPTGGYKGQTREVDPDELRARVARAFRIEQDQIVGEYGMTELSSQLYERAGEPRGVYFAPPWLRVEPVDPVTLEPMPEGEVGLARFVDLGNVDSAVAIVTQDLIRRRGAGVELCGRRSGAPLRGCSLAVEEIVR